MQLNVRMFFKELLHLPSFVGRDIVQDNVDFFVLGLMHKELLQKGHEFLAGVPRYGLSQDLSSLRIKGSNERERPVSIILKPMPLSPSRRHRQNRIFSIQGLDRGLLIHTKDSRVLRWFDIQANDYRP